MKCPFCGTALELWTDENDYGPGPMRISMSSPEEHGDGQLSMGPIPMHGMPIVELHRCPGCGFLAAFETPASQRDVHRS